MQIFQINIQLQEEGDVIANKYSLGSINKIKPKMHECAAADRY